MTRHPQPTRRAAATLIGAVVALLLLPTVARAGEACPDADSGVTVVVDLRAAGGGIEVGCAPGAPPSGFAALQAAGFAVTEVPSMPGFLCQIDGKPSDEDCADTPPADAFWSYWSAPRGGSWSYSIVGGATRTPPPGTVDGWAFGAGSAPAMSPPGEAPPTTTTSTTTTSTTTTAAPATTTTTTAAPVATTTTTASTTTVAATTTTTTTSPIETTSSEATATTTAGAVASAGSTTTSVAASTTRAIAPETTSVVGAAPGTTVAASRVVPAGDDHGPNTSAVVALVALGAVAIAGAAVAVRRRRVGS